MFKALTFSFFLISITAPMRADSIQIFHDRAQWVAAVEAHDAHDKITTEHFNHNKIHTGITLGSMPTFPQQGLVGAPGFIQINEWSSFVHDGLAGPRYDLLTFPEPVDAFGGNFSFRWSGSDDGLYSNLNGTFEPIQRSGGPCGGYFGGQARPPCPKHHPSVARGFFGWIDYSATFQSIQLTTLDGDEPDIGHGGLGLPYTLDNLSFQDPSAPHRNPQRSASRVGIVARSGEEETWLSYSRFCFCAPARCTPIPSRFSPIALLGPKQLRRTIVKTGS